MLSIVGERLKSQVYIARACDFLSNAITFTSLQEILSIAQIKKKGESVKTVFDYDQ